MHPILFKIGPITIHTYGFLLALGVLGSIFLSLSLAKKEKIDPKQLSDLIFYTILIGLVGAKLFLLVTEFKFYSENPGQIKYLLTSAGTFYGGLIFGIIFAAWFIKRHNLNFRVIGDLFAPAVALAHFFGRLGCFFAGCCFGRGAEGCPISVTFTSLKATTGVPLNIAVYPTQLIEASLNFLNFLILIFLYKKKHFQGQIFILYILNYSIIRFIVEFFRGDDDRGYIFGGIDNPFSSLSVPQFISILGIIFAIILYTRFKKLAADSQVTIKK
jgi:phosphatidylglycerol:prolipoprotein diacylglycerol transferase